MLVLFPPTRITPFLILSSSSPSSDLEPFFINFIEISSLPVLYHNSIVLYLAIFFEFLPSFFHRLYFCTLLLNSFKISTKYLLNNIYTQYYSFLSSYLFIFPPKLGRLGSFRLSTKTLSLTVPQHLHVADLEKLKKQKDQNLGRFLTFQLAFSRLWRR